MEKNGTCREGIGASCIHSFPSNISEASTTDMLIVIQNCFPHMIMCFFFALPPDALILIFVFWSVLSVRIFRFFCSLLRMEGDCSLGRLQVIKKRMLIPVTSFPETDESMGVSRAETLAARSTPRGRFADHVVYCSPVRYGMSPPTMRIASWNEWVRLEGATNT
jgi:hypothetical protein